MTKWLTFHAHFIKSAHGWGGFLRFARDIFSFFNDPQTLSLLFCLIFYESFVYLFEFACL